MKTILITILLFCASFTQANDMTLVEMFCDEYHFDLISQHQKDTYIYRGEEHHYNEVHESLGCVWGGTNKKLRNFAFTFRNSYYDDSIAIGKFWRDDTRWTNVSPQVFAGVVFGYKDHLPNWKEQVSPYAFIGLDFHPANNKYGITINTAIAVHVIGFRYSF